MALRNTFLFGLVIFGVVCDGKIIETQVEKIHDGPGFVGRMMEQGRTLVHHTMKRLMIIAPIIFFKLGIAFTMLLLVTVVSVNNGFIGFLILVVGLSSVLARLQEARKSAVVPVPYYNPVVPVYNRHYQDWDRSDKIIPTPRTTTQSYDQQYVYSISGYNPTYYGQKAV